MAADQPETRIAVMESRLDNHEKVCSERYEAIADNLKDMAGKQDKTMWATIAALATIIGYVFMNWAPWLRAPH